MIHVATRRRRTSRHACASMASERRWSSCRVAAAAREQKSSPGAAPSTRTRPKRSRRPEVSRAPRIERTGRVTMEDSENGEHLAREHQNRKRRLIVCHSAASTAPRPHRAAVTRAAAPRAWRHRNRRNTAAAAPASAPTRRRRNKQACWPPARATRRRRRPPTTTRPSSPSPSPPRWPEGEKKICTLTGRDLYYG